jgi:monoamine oxidase
VKPLSRRDFVVAAGSSLTAASLAGCGASNLGLPSGAHTDEPNDLSHAGKIYDVIVIGGGAAGIGAALTVRSYGRSVLVLEAQNRPGGRALTDNTTFKEVGFDLGAQFFGHVQAGNVLFGVASARKIPVSDFSTYPQFYYLGTKKAPKKDENSFVATIGGMIGGELAGGALITNPSGDYPISRITNAFLKDPYYQNAIGISVETDAGVGPKEASTLDLFNFLIGSPSPFNTPGDSYIVKSGMGNFIQSLATGLPIKLNTSVQRVTRNASGVTVATNKGTFAAKTAILAVSTGVLGANVIDFKPALPAATREAIAALPLGVVYKAALGFSTDIFPQLNGMTSVVPLSSSEPAITYFAKFWGYNIVEILADADLALKIEGMSRSGQINYLLGRLEQNVPGAASAFDGRFTGSNWGHNPFTYGSYSHAKVGMTEARVALRKSVANQLYFAGEAVAETSTITLLQGAYNSGIAAASGALKAIGVNVRSHRPAVTT